MTTPTHTDPVFTDEREAVLQELERAAEAGEFDHATREGVEYLRSQLPEGYILEDSRVVRLDPTLPDELYVPSRFNGVPTGDLVRVPVYK